VLTFRDFLIEVARSPDRALKLLNYLDKRSGGKDYVRPVPRSDVAQPEDLKYVNSRLPNRDSATLIDRVKKMYGGKPYPAPTKVSVKKIIPIQNTVETPGVADKLKGGNNVGDTGPVHIIRSGGKHYLLDGHHRFMAARLRGDTHIDAYVHTLPKKPVGN
jgi:hypothetical protein